MLKFFDMIDFKLIFYDFFLTTELFLFKNIFPNKDYPVIVVLTLNPTLISIDVVHPSVLGRIVD